MNQRQEEIRREDQRYRGRFRRMMLLSLAGGLVLGLSAVKLWGLDEESKVWFSTTVIPVLGCAVVWLCGGVQWIAGAVLRRKSVQSIENAQTLDDEGREAAQEAVEQPLNLLLSLCALSCTSAFTGMGLAVAGFRSEEAVMSGVSVGVAAVVGLWVFLAVMLHYQRWAINFIKEQNPEKRGSVYQTDFNKTWVESCDEAERAQIYRAGYAGYRAAVMTCLVLWVLSVMGIVAGLLSWTTVLFVGIIWIASQVGYIKSAAKQGKSGTSAY